MTTSNVSYVPTSPADVVDVTRLRLFATSGRVGTPIVDTGPAVQQPNGSWLFTFPTPPDGVYYSSVTANYTDGRTYDDTNDVITLPPPPELEAGEQWVAAWELDNPQSTDARDAAATASYIMYALSGRKYTGLRKVTETYTLPMMAAMWHKAQTEALLQHRIGGGFSYPTRDPAFRKDYLYLRGRPVQHVNEVRQGPNFGTVLTPSQYRVYNRSILELDTGVQQETQVTYQYGSRPPAMGRRAARTLANEIIKAMNGQECRLPERVTSITRQGVSLTVIDPHEFLDKGRTGLYEVDLFLHATNPNGANARSRVFSPDTPRVRRYS